MVNCAVNGCDNSTTYKPPEQIERESNGHIISFHRFPRLEARKKLWIQALDRANWMPDDKSVVCSDHFSAECFERTDVHTYITKFAVPSIFPSDIKSDENTFEFIPFSNPNEILRINKDTLNIADPLDVPQIKLEEAMETETILVKEELTEEFEEKPVVNQIIIPVGGITNTNTNNNETCDTSAQTDASVQMDEVVPDQRFEEEEIEKTKVYKKRIKTLQQQIRRQDKLIENLEKKIAEIRGTAN